MTFAARFGLLVKSYREGDGISATNLALKALGDGAKRSRISELENGKVASPHAKTINALSEALGISQEEVDACRQPPSVSDDQLTADTVREDYGSLTGALDALRDLSRSQLEMLARRFDIEEPAAIRDSKLVALLEKKAMEYKTYKSQIDMIDERIAGLGNLKAAAQEAAERLDFAEVENLLSMVHETELDIAWQTASLRADNALLRGRVDDAYHILSAAADAFAAVDPVEPARRRSAATHRFYYHGIRYGSIALERYLNMINDAILNIDSQKFPFDWALLQRDRAVALAQFGSRLGGEQGEDFLNQAAECNRTALSVFEVLNDRSEWATTLINHGTMLSELADRKNTRSKNDLLEQSVQSFETALEEKTQTKDPETWATIKLNLGTSLRKLGLYQNNCLAIEYLNRSVAAIESSLTVRTKANYPNEWAEANNNIGNTLVYLGSMITGQTGLKILEKAFVHFDGAQRVHTRSDYPRPWAMTQANQALALEAMAEHDTCADPRLHLEAALACLDNALKVFEPEALPNDYKFATETRARIAGKLAALDGT